VEFYDGTSLIGTDTSGPYGIVWSRASAGDHYLTAKATNSLTKTTTSTTVKVSIRKSLASVEKAISDVLALRDALASQTGYAIQNSGASNQSVAAQYKLLTASVEEAYEDFRTELSLFDEPAKINNQLVAGLLFARSCAASSLVRNTPSSVSDRINKIVAHLEMAEELILEGSLSASTIAKAQAAKARTDVVVGAPEAKSSASIAPFISPVSLAVVTSSSSLMPLTTQEGTASPDANGSFPYLLAGVSVTVGGQAATVISVSPSHVGFVIPRGVASGNAEVIVTSDVGYISRGTVNVSDVAPGLFTVGGTGTGEAVALNAGTYGAQFFNVTTGESLANDKRTRLMLFATGLSNGVANIDTGNDVNSGDKVILNLAESVSVEARTGDGRRFNLPVEFMGAQGGFSGLDQLTVVLVPELLHAGGVELAVMVNDQTSNIATININ